MDVTKDNTQVKTKKSKTVTNKHNKIKVIGQRKLNWFRKVSTSYMCIYIGCVCLNNPTKNWCSLRSAFSLFISVFFLFFIWLKSMYFCAFQPVKSSCQDTKILLCAFQHSEHVVTLFLSLLLQWFVNSTTNLLFGDISDLRIRDVMQRMMWIFNARRFTSSSA